MNKKYIYITLGIIAIILVSLYIGNSIDKKEQKDKQSIERIKVVQVDSKERVKQIDSLNNIIKGLSGNVKVIKEKEIIIREKANDIVIEKPQNEECNDLYKNCTEKISLLQETISIKDSVEGNLNSIITNKDYIIGNKDKIITNKDEEIRLTKSLSKPRSKKIVIGLQLGTGGAITKNQNNVNIEYVPVYVGVGVTYKIFEF